MVEHDADQRGEVPEMCYGGESPVDGLPRLPSGVFFSSVQKIPFLPPA